MTSETKGGSGAGTLRHGDFTGLAENYSRYRPGYSPTILDSLLAIVGVPVDEMDVADVGAGTGIFSRLVAARGPRSMVSIEPNADMRAAGIHDSQHTAIRWMDGSGEETGLGDGSVDLLTAASCFHWMDFDTASAEFHRVLRPAGRFVAVWNPRYIQANPMLVEIEQKLYDLAPHISRVSSGSSDFTASLTDRLWASPHFEDVVYLEGRHIKRFTPEEYLGVWRSVNDIQVQAGPEIFGQFLRYIEERLAGVETIDAQYRTLAWSARRAD